MSTTLRTDGALLSSDCAYNCGHTFKLLIEEKYDQGKCVSTGRDIAQGNDGLVVLADFARALESELIAAIARAERAEAELATEKDNRNHLIEKGAKIETELAASKAECDLAITRVASILWSGAIDKHTCGDVQQWVTDYTAELARLRAEVEQKRNLLVTAITSAGDQAARAERAEAEIECWRDSNNRLRAEMESQAQRAERAEAAMLKP